MARSPSRARGNGADPPAPGGRGPARPVAPGRGILGTRLPLAARVVASGCLLATGGVHLVLYASAGYRFIPTIGWLFLLTVIGAGGLALAELVVASPGLGLLSAGFLASVLAGYGLAATVGLFGYTETGQATAAALAGAVEVGGVLALLGGLLAARRRPS